MRILWSPALAGLTLAAASGALVVQATAEPLAQSAQTATTDRRFEVASVKPSLLSAELSQRVGLIQALPGGRFIAEARLKQLIVHAFEVRTFQVEGGPAWLTSDYFEITANAGADATPADVKAMLRTLLAERFGLRTRTETRQTPVYMLTVARSDGTLGPRLTRATPECIEQIAQRRDGTAPIAPPPTAAEAEREITRMMSRDSRTTPRCGSYMDGIGWNGASRLVFGGAELTVLVSLISSQVSAPVVDQTRLSGLFDVTLDYTSERQLPGRGTGLDPNGTDVPPPALGVALERQLGLKLERQIGPMPVVIFDAVTRPAPN